MSASLQVKVMATSSREREVRTGLAFRAVTATIQAPLVDKSSVSPVSTAAEPRFENAFWHSKTSDQARPNEEAEGFVQSIPHADKNS